MENPVHRSSGVIAFADTDASGWMHFPNIFKFVEAAEHEFLREQRILVFDRALGGWPRVKVSCDFKKPFRTGDRYDVLLWLSELGNASLTWKFEVWNESDEVAAFGMMTNVRVDHEGRPQMISNEDRTTLERVLS